MLSFFKQKVNTDPVKEFVEGWKPHQFTPDYAWLETRMYQLVFLYNEIQTGFPKHQDFITDTTGMLGTAFTQESCYEMYVKNLGQESFPVVVEKKEKSIPYIYTSPAGRIKGELYAFQPTQILELDKYLKNGVEFQRERIKTVLFYFKHNKDTDAYTRCAYIVRAWMYIGLPAYWNTLIDAGFLFSKGKKFASPTTYAKLADYYYYGPKQTST